MVTDWKHEATLGFSRPSVKACLRRTPKQRGIATSGCCINAQVALSQNPCAVRMARDQRQDRAVPTGEVSFDLTRCIVTAPPKHARYPSDILQPVQIQRTCRLNSRSPKCLNGVSLRARDLGSGAHA